MGATISWKQNEGVVGVTARQSAVLRHMRATTFVLLGRAHRATTGKSMGGRMPMQHFTTRSETP